MPTTTTTIDHPNGLRQWRPILNNNNNDDDDNNQEDEKGPYDVELGMWFDDDGGRSVEAWTAAILSQATNNTTTTIKSLNIDFCYPDTDEFNNAEPMWSSEACRDFFRAIGSLPDLHRLRLWGFGDFNNRIPFCCITEALNLPNRQFKSIDLVFFTVRINNTNEVTEFSNSLGTQLLLEDFGLWQFDFNRRDIPVLFAPVVAALSALPSLTRVDIWDGNDHNREFGCTSDGIEAFGRLCSSTTLQSFTCEAFVLSDDCLVNACLALQTNRNLEYLSIYLDGDITSVGCSAVTEMLRINESIENIQFNIRFSSKDLLLNIADALSTNSTLEEVKITCWARYGAKLFTVKEEEAFASMLETNCVLTLLTLTNTFENYNGIWRPKIDFFLNLNQNGRGRVLQEYDSMSSADWVGVLINSADDLSHLFYYLTLKPTICQA